MRLSARVYKDAPWWIVEIPILDAMTQGKSKRESLNMGKDLIESLAGDASLRVDVQATREGHVEFSATDSAALTGLILRRQRSRSGLTLSEVANRLGSSSRNAYARYEQGRSVPTIEKFDQLLRAVSPDRDLVIGQSLLPREQTP